jgi:hypothetical protein
MEGSIWFDAMTGQKFDGLIVVVVYPDGSVDAAGVARLPGEGTYRAVGGSAECADLDGDGINGLVALTADFDRLAGGDRTLRAEAEFVVEDEIDEPGIYPIRLLWNGEPAGEAMLRVRFVPAGRP